MTVLSAIVLTFVLICGIYFIYQFNKLDKLDKSDLEEMVNEYIERRSLKRASKVYKLYTRKYRRLSK